MDVTIDGQVAQLTQSNCQNLQSEAQLRQFLIQAQTVNTPIGGLFQGTRMWGAVVNRDGEICTYATSTTDSTQVWPGSQAIAKAKAYTANAFSLDTLFPSRQLAFIRLLSRVTLFGAWASQTFLIHSF